MNIEQAKTIVTDEAKKTKYVLSRENDIYGIKTFIGSTAGCGLIFLGGFETHPIITSIGIITLGALMTKGIELSKHYSKEEKLEMKKDYYSNLMLKKYKKQLKKGINPLESTEFSHEAFIKQLDNDINIKYVKVLK